MSKSPFKNTSRSNFSTGFSTVLGITLVLTTVGLMSIVFFVSKGISDEFRNGLTIQVMLEDTMSEADRLKMKKELEVAAHTSTVRYISKDEAAAIQIEELGEDFVEFLGENPLPASFDLRLKPAYTQPDSVTWVVQQLQSRLGVKEIVYHQNLFQTVSDNLTRINIGLAVFMILLLIISMALINNTIRLAVFSKRFIIKSMQLVGATRGFIRRPFVWRGIWLGFLSALIAVAIISGMLYALREDFPEIPETMVANRYYVPMIIVMVATGVLISWISTMLAVNKFIRLKQEQLY